VRTGRTRPGEVQVSSIKYKYGLKEDGLTRENEDQPGFPAVFDLCPLCGVIAGGVSYD